MKKMIESITGGYVSSAKVVDGALILSLPDAISPVVWRMDLTSVKSSALEVRDHKDGTFMLTLKTPRDDVTNIAPFTEKAIAVRALMAVSHALEHGHSHHANIIRSPSLVTSEIPPPRYAAPPQADSGVTKWVTGIAAVLVLFILIGVLMHQSPKTSSFNSGGAGGLGNVASGIPSPPPANGIAPSTTATGVPVSADDFLRENSKPQ